MARRHLTFDGLESRSLMSTTPKGMTELAPIWVIKPELMDPIVDRVPYEIDTIGLANPALPEIPQGLLDISVMVSKENTLARPSEKFVNTEVPGAGRETTFGTIDLGHLNTGEYEVTISAWDGSLQVQGKQSSTRIFKVVSPVIASPFFAVSVLK